MQNGCVRILYGKLKENNKEDHDIEGKICTAGYASMN